jgi:hypothetical protein
MSVWDNETITPQANLFQSFIELLKLDGSLGPLEGTESRRAPGWTSFVTRRPYSDITKRW